MFNREHIACLTSKRKRSKKKKTSKKVKTKIPVNVSI